MTPRQFLGKELCRARVAAGFSSQQALADHLQFERTTVAKVESGDRALPALRATAVEPFPWFGRKSDRRIFAAIAVSISRSLRAQIVQFCWQSDSGRCSLQHLAMLGGCLWNPVPVKAMHGTFFILMTEECGVWLIKYGVSPRHTAKPLADEAIDHADRPIPYGQLRQATTCQRRPACDPADPRATA